MDLLDKETFSYWVTHPEELLPCDFQQLQETIARYPYCQSLYTLTAKVASTYENDQTVECVRQASVRALNRNALRKLIENEFQWSNHLLGRLNELSLKHVPIPEDYQKESYALFKARTEQRSFFPNFTFFDFATPGFAQLKERFIEPSTLESESTEINSPDPSPIQLATELAIAEKELQQQDQDERVVLTPQPNADLIRQNEIIENFIRNQPRITPLRSRQNEMSEQEDLARRNPSNLDGFITESFAKILISQGKQDKAINIYEKLMVKNPTKSAYFAKKITELNQQKTK